MTPTNALPVAQPSDKRKSLRIFNLYFDGFRRPRAISAAANPDEVSRFTESAPRPNTKD
jgi:hypothetical protein